MDMKHVITVLVENEPGVLARVVGLIAGRGFNIDSLNVAATQNPKISRMTIQVPGDDHVLDQVQKQVSKLIDVIKVSDLTQERYVDRELVLVKVAVSPAKRGELKELATMMKADIVSVQEKALIIQMTGNREQTKDFVEMLEPYKILDISRSGVIAVAKNSDSSVA